MALDYKKRLDRLVSLQRGAQQREGAPTAAIRADRLMRGADMLEKAGEEIAAIVSKDFGHRSFDETRLEISGAIWTLRLAAANVESWMAPAVHTPMAPDAGARVEYIPRGVIGLVGPWNYPIFPIFAPLAGVLAAGNRAILKPSEQTPRTAALLERLVRQTFSQSEVAVIQGGAREGELFSRSGLDHLVFTGSTSVGRQVMRSAAENRTSVTLELGGKCPVLISKEIDLTIAAERIMAAKVRNAGQICLAPDYVLVPEASRWDFAQHCILAARRMFPKGIESDDYTSIVNAKHHSRLKAILEDADSKGGKLVVALPHTASARSRRMPPTLILDPRPDMLAMTEEIFGPILPVVGYRTPEDALATIGALPRPLAFYRFASDAQLTRTLLDGTSGEGTFNGGTTAEVAEDLPFGGIGPSVMGTYRGREGFRAFSHARGIYRQGDAAAGALLDRPCGQPSVNFLSSGLAG